MSLIIRNTTGGTITLDDIGMTLGIPAAQVQDVDTVADTAGSLNSTYFLLESMSTKYYVWYDVSSGGTDPGIAGSADTGGRTGVEVDITTGDSADDVATATRSAIGALADFSTGGATNVVTITNAAVGDVPDAKDGTAATGFTFDVPTTQGAGARDLRTEDPTVVHESQDLLDAIAAGDVEVLDPLDGTTALSEANSLLAVQVHNDPHFRGGPGLDLWATFDADTGSTTADVPADTLTVAGGTGISTTIAGDTLTIATTGGVGMQNLFETITGDTGSAVADNTTDTVALIGATNGGITTIASSTPDEVTFSVTPIDLTTGGATLALGDFLIVSDSADTATTIPLKYTFTDIVEDLDIPNAITVNGFVVRTAADTYASRTLDASVDEDELGIVITDGDGVAGDPQIGLDIVGLTDPAADLATTDEFPVHDKSEGTGGANRKMTGQNVSDGVLSIAGLTGLTITTIGGQEVLTLIDTTRASKVLSVETSAITWSENVIGSNDWLDVGGATHADLGYVIPLNATIVKMTGHTADNRGNARDIDLYIDDVLSTSSIVVFTGSPSGQEEDSDVTLNIDVTAGEKLQLRGDAAAGNLDDVVITLWLKWRG